MLEGQNGTGFLVNKFDLRNSNRLIYKFSGDVRIICLHASVRLKIINFLLNCFFSANLQLPLCSLHAA